MLDIPTENYLAHLNEIIEDQVQPLSNSFRYYAEFLRDTANLIDKGRFTRVIVKLFKEIKKNDDPRGLKIGEMLFALNNAWQPTGHFIIQKTADPKIFIIRFTNAGDFAAAIYSIPNRVHGKLLTMRMWSSTQRIEDIDFTAQDFWISFELRGELVEKGNVAIKVAEKVGKVLTLIGPVNEKGEYQAHVIADLTTALVHQVKIIILDGVDRETIKLRKFFMVIPHGTCRKCWNVDGEHSDEKCRPRIAEYKRNMPKVYVYIEDGEIPGANNQADIAIELEDVARSINHPKEVDSSEKEGPAKTGGSTDNIGIIGGRRYAGLCMNNLSNDEQRRMKGKSIVPEGSNDNQKELKQKKKQENWFRMMSQYTGLGGKKSIVINEPMNDKEEGRNNEWWMVEDNLGVLREGAGHALLQLSRQSELSNQEIESIVCESEEDKLCWSIIEAEAENRTSTDQVMANTEVLAANPIPMEHAQPNEVFLFKNFKTQYDKLDVKFISHLKIICWHVFIIFSNILLLKIYRTRCKIIFTKRSVCMCCFYLLLFLKNGMNSLFPWYNKLFLYGDG
ncbi:hypothetical protein MKW98_025754 [Papaver atlanticum]|uniref:DUF4283 domain-containing protein n=1 Tax=Papaver atlanticum TaxID=357466 RepID=A0AAD4XC24_9MAGN|nr:hypothetical protein MKW98_025754 [Papaver atlanticum]